MAAMRISVSNWSTTEDGRRRVGRRDPALRRGRRRARTHRARRPPPPADGRAYSARMSVGTAFHPATSPLNRKQQWREWSGYFASSSYADAHDIEYNAIREAAALIDVSPLYKYVVGGPDARRLVDRVITRDATKLTAGPGLLHAVVRRARQGHRRRHGPRPRRRDVPLDGRRSAAALAADEQRRPRRDDRRHDRADRRGRAPGPAVAGRPRGRDRRVVRGSRLLPAAGARRSRSAGGRSPLDVSRTGYTGDLGYELWIDADQAVALWDALWAAGQDHAIRPAGMLALDVVRLEAGLILLEVDYTSARHAMNPEQNYSPGEIGLGRLVTLRQGRLRRAGSRSSARPARAARPAGWSGSSSTGTGSRGCSAPRACRRRSRRSSIARRGRCSSAAARSVGRRRSAGARSSSRRSRSRRCRRRHEALGSQARRRVDGRGPPRPRPGDGRRPAVPRSRAEARLTDAPLSTTCRGRRGRPSPRSAAGDQQADRVRPDVEQGIPADHPAELRQERATGLDRARHGIDLDDAALVLRPPVELERPDRAVARGRSSRASGTPRGSCRPGPA